MLMTSEQATTVCNEMWQDLDTADPELGAAQVIRTLLKIAQNTSSPLAAVEAAEVLCALDPDGWATGTDSSRN